VSNRKNSFEFFGYDFMVDEDLRVWLIEVNSSPSMDTKSCPILARMVKNVLTDLAKVVIDYPKNKKCDTGGFSLVVRAKHEVQRPKGNMNCDLRVDGFSLAANMLANTRKQYFSTMQKKAEPNQQQI
jgi:hypothetical protein